MAFKNITFPQLQLLHNVSRTCNDSTVVFSNGNKEFRLRRTKNDLLNWSWPARNMLKQDALILQSFYNEVEGGFYAFKYKDPYDYSWSDYSLKWLDTNRWKVVSNTGSPIYFGTISDCKLNGVSQGSKTISLVNDEPVITVSGSNNASTVTITGTFYFVARFSSNISCSSETFDSNLQAVVISVDSFNLKEVREYA